MVQRSEVNAETWAVVAGRGAAGAGAPLNVPPVPASNFQLGSDRAYSRDDATPTWEAFEELLGGLEGGEAVAFASGMGAAAAVFDLLPVGAKVVLGDDCYQAVSGLAAAGAERGRWDVERVGVEDTSRAEVPFEPWTIAERARRAWAAAGLRSITLHECRHTYASLMIAAGVNAKALQTFMGHASITITLDRYGNLFPGSEADAAVLLNAYLDQANA